MSLHKLLIFLFTSMLVVLSGCSGCDNFGTTRSGRIVVEPAEVIFVGAVVGNEVEQEVTIQNTADTELRVYAVYLEKSAEEGGNIDGLALKGVNDSEFSVEANKSFTFNITYKANGQTTPLANIIFRTSDPNYTLEQPLKVRVSAVEASVEVTAQPNPLRFAKSQPGQRFEKTLTIRNQGMTPVEIMQMPQIIASTDFKIAGASFNGQKLTDASFPLRLESYLTDEASEKSYLTVDVVYAPLGVGDPDGSIETTYRPFGSSDTKGQSFRVPVLATATGPCIQVDQVARNFGQVPVGGSAEDFFEIHNCGTEDLLVSDIALTKNSADNEFSLSLDNFPTNGSGKLSAPITITPGTSSKPVTLTYLPSAEGTDTGELVIKSNDAYQPELKLDLTGRGSNGACPIVSVGGYVEGVSATPSPTVAAKPLDYVILDASASHDPDGRIASYQWTPVKLPLGASSTLEPTKGDTTNSDQSRRRYRPLVAGTYEFLVDVIDNEGFAGCAPALVKIVATPAKKIHIELTWRNPEDPDETDNVGSDVDLHMVKMGPGKWFKAPYDIYFKNKTTFWNPEKPTLDIDDRDGAGPENIQLDNPGNCEWYAVGVDYYKQIYGTAYITVRIYINSQLKFEAVNLPLMQHKNFYDIARIHWNGNDATILAIEQFYKERPDGVAPTVTPEMSAKNGGTLRYCTAQNLY